MMPVYVEIPEQGLDMDTIDELLPAVQAFVDQWLAERTSKEASDG